MEEKVKLTGCEKCGLYKTSCVNTPQGTFFAKKMMGRGLPNAKVMFILEAPGQEDCIQQKIAAGSEGRELNKMLTDLGINPEEVYVTCVCKCRPPENRIPKASEVKECWPFLLEEIQAVKPKVMVPMGATAVEAILHRKGLQTIHGTLFDVEIEGIPVKVIPMNRPAYILKWPEYPNLRADLVKDLKLMKQAIEGGETFVKAKRPVAYTNLGDMPSAEIVKQVKAYVEKIKQAGYFSYDIETTGFNFLTDRIISIALCCEETKGIGFYLDDASSIDLAEIFLILKEIFESRSIMKIGHNMKFDNKFFRAKNIIVKLPCFDTMLSHFLLDENSLHGLKDLAYKYTDMGGYDDELDKTYKELILNKRKELMALKKEGKITADQYEEQMAEYEAKGYSILPKKLLLEYNIADTDCTLRLYNLFKDMMVKEGVATVHEKILMPLQYVLAETEYNGVQIDLEYLHTFEKELLAQVEDLLFRLMSRPEVKEAEKLSNPGLTSESKEYKTFNPNSNPMLQTLLYRVAKLPGLQKTKTGFSTDAETLGILAEKSELVKVLLDYRVAKHDLTSYVVNFKKAMDSKGKLHTDYMLHGSVSGRIISHTPNLQNIKRKSNVMKLFVAEPGCILLSADYGQIEYRMWGNYSNDPQMLGDINNDLDIHSDVACEVWPHLYQKIDNTHYRMLQTGEIKSKVGGEHRVIAKAVVFGLMFGRGVKSLVEELGITEAEANKIIHWFFNKYPGASQWIMEQKKMAHKMGYVVTLFGRRRRLPEIMSRDNELVAQAERQAVNTPIQSGASDVCSIATIRTYNNMKRAGLQSKLILSIHDSLKYNVPLNELEKAKECIQHGMCDSIPGIKFPLLAEFEIGVNWRDLIEYEDFEKEPDKYLHEWGLK